MFPVLLAEKVCDISQQSLGLNFKITLYFIICERVMKYNKEGADYMLNQM